LTLIKNYKAKTKNIKIGIPNKGTCLYITSLSHSALTGYINDVFTKKLMVFSKSGNNFFKIKMPVFNQCVKLTNYEKK